MSPLMIVHIAAGSLGILSGAAALSVRKGERLHRGFGTVFFGAMLVMAATGAGLAMVQPHTPTVIVGVLTFYFVATAWAAARRKIGLGVFERFAFLLPAATAAVLILFGFQAINSATGKFADLPPLPYFLVAGFVAFIAALDLSVVVRGGVSGPHRIARHLWRMCTALTFGAGFFFLGQQEIFPAFLQGSPILFLPELAPLCLMLFWLVRVLFTRAWRGEDAVAPLSP